MIVVRRLLLVPAVDLGEVMVLEGGVEVFEKMFDGDDCLVGQFREVSQRGFVVHVSGPL